jgi:hypothetical protein
MVDVKHAAHPDILGQKHAAYSRHVAPPHESDADLAAFLAPEDYD